MCAHGGLVGKCFRKTPAELIVVAWGPFPLPAAGKGHVSPVHTPPPRVGPHRGPARWPLWWGPKSGGTRDHAELGLWLGSSYPHIPCSCQLPQALPPPPFLLWLPAWVSIFLALLQNGIPSPALPSSPDLETQMKTESLEVNTRVSVTNNKINSEEEGLSSGCLPLQAIVFTHLCIGEYKTQPLSHQPQVHTAIRRGGLRRACRHTNKAPHHLVSTGLKHSVQTQLTARYRAIQVTKFQNGTEVTRNLHVRLHGSPKSKCCQQARHF